MHTKELFKSKAGICFPGTSEQQILYMYPWEGKIIMGTLVNFEKKPDVNPSYSKKNAEEQKKLLCNLFSSMSEPEIEKTITARWGGMGYVPSQISPGTNQRKTISNFQVVQTGFGMAPSSPPTHTHTHPSSTHPRTAGTPAPAHQGLPARMQIPAAPRNNARIPTPLNNHRHIQFLRRQLDLLSQASGVNG